MPALMAVIVQMVGCVSFGAAVGRDKNDWVGWAAGIVGVVEFVGGMLWLAFMAQH